MRKRLNILLLFSYKTSFKNYKTTINPYKSEQQILS